MAPLNFQTAPNADLSSRPARSIFLLIDSFNAGKAGQALGMLKRKEEPRAVAARGVTHFRIWSTHLAVEILEALVRGRLPLLPVDATEGPAVYLKTVDACLTGRATAACAAMNDLLSDLWTRSKLPDPHWSELGLGGLLMPAAVGDQASLGCHVIRKFSAFQAQLASVQPDASTVAAIGGAFAGKC